MPKMPCPKCSKVVNYPDVYEGKRKLCPNCKVEIFLSQNIEKQEKVKDLDIVISLPPISKSNKEKVGSSDTQLSWGNSDKVSRIIWGVGVGSLALICISTLFTWFRVLTGGTLGISGDGKYMLGLSLVALIWSTASFAKGSRFKIAAIAASAFGTFVLFWMGALFYHITSVSAKLSAGGSGLSAVLASQFGPGVGLYLALFSSISTIISFGYLALKMPSEEELLYKKYLALEISQGVAVVIGVLLVFVISSAKVGKSRASATQKKCKSSIIHKNNR